ncbi:MAG: DNA polymerase III subunit gamma/tau [Thermodesulfobacteriota bacterium]
MSYIVLARKWRPQTFKEVIGQRHVVHTLENALSYKRIAHGYIFSGARGIGKTTVARIFAKSLNCEKGVTNNPCNECSICKEITNGSSVDVIEIDGASNTGVDDVREIKDNVRYLPSKGRYKVYIIDEVHMLSTSAFNALLKTLEEPPSHVVFIFATTEPHKIPLTVLSRCQRFDFRRLTTEEVKHQLNMIASNEGIKTGEDAISLISKQAEGSMRDAESLMDQIVSYAGTEFTCKDVSDILGLIDKDLIFEAIGALIRKEAVAALKVIEKAYDFGYDEKRFSQDLLEHIRDLTVIKSIEDSGKFLDYTIKEIQELKGLVEGIEIEDLHILFYHLSKGLEDLSRSPYPRIILEMLFLKIVGLPPMRSISEFVGRLEDIEKKGGKGEQKAPKEEVYERESFSTREMATKRDTQIDGGKWEGWGAFLEFVMKKRPSLWSHLNSVHLISQDDKKIVLGVSKGHSFDYLMDLEVKDNLEGLYKDFYGRTARVGIREVSNGDIENKTSMDMPMTRHEKGSALEPLGDPNAMRKSFVENVAEVFGRNIREIKTGGL